MKFNPQEIADKSRTIYDVQGALAVIKSQPSKFVCWGVTEIRLIGETKEDIRTIRLTANGLIHKGYVYVFLNGKDLYEFYLVSLDGELVKEVKDLFFDQLVDVIDQEIEYGVNTTSKEYQAKVFEESVNQLNN